METSKQFITSEEFKTAKQPLMRRYIRIRRLITTILDEMLKECKFCDMMKARKDMNHHALKDIDHHSLCKACPVYDLCVEKGSLYHEIEGSLEKAKTDLLSLYMNLRERHG